MNPGNYREALIELEADEAEGADILMVTALHMNLESFALVKGGLRFERLSFRNQFWH